MAKFFISYSSKEPDASIAKEFNDKLKTAGHEIFLASESIKIGEEWAARIEKEINSFEYFLVLLSNHSKMSDMVIEEIRKAKKYYDSAYSKPGILPIRVNIPFDKPINYDVDGYLNKFQQRLIRENNTKDIIAEILELVAKRSDNSVVGKTNEVLHENLPTGATQDPVPSAALILPAGLVGLDSPFYVERDQEKAKIKYILDNDSALLRITGPRQFGKTSVLQRIVNKAEKAGYRVVNLSFQLYEENTISDLDLLMKEFSFSCATMAGINEEDVNEQIQKIWSSKGGGSKRKAFDFFERFFIKNISGHVLIALDEVDRVFEYESVSKEFFSFLRLFNEHAKIPGKEAFGKIKMVLAHSAEAVLAIPTNEQSPFNIGDEYHLQEFTKKEINWLNVRYNLSLDDQQIETLRSMIGGHPFLIRKSLYLIASRQFTFEELKEKSIGERGPFDDNLKRLLWYISRNVTLQKIVRILLNDQLIDSNVENLNPCYRLNAHGITEGSPPRIQMKYSLYKNFLQDKMG